MSGNYDNFIMVTEDTAIRLFRNSKTELFYVREDGEGLIEDVDGLVEALFHNSVGIEDFAEDIERPLISEESIQALLNLKREGSQ